MSGNRIGGIVCGKQVDLESFRMVGSVNYSKPLLCHVFGVMQLQTNVIIDATKSQLAQSENFVNRNPNTKLTYLMLSCTIIA